MPQDPLRLIGRGVVPPVLNDPKRRVEMGLPADEKELGRYMIELNILYRGGLREASKAFNELWSKTPKGQSKKIRRLEIRSFCMRPATFRRCIRCPELRPPP